MGQRHSKYNSLERLRDGKRILGYRRKEGNAWFYSRDLLWWNGTSMEFNEVDAHIGFKDKDDRLLFVNDIIEVRLAFGFRKKRTFRVAHINEKVVLFDWHKDKASSLSLLEQVTTMKFVSYTFLNADRAFRQSRN